MPRSPREISESGIYHVMVRGVSQLNIFLDEEDRERFLRTLYKFKGLNGVVIYAYCLMSNHVHLLIKEVDEVLSNFMKKVGVSYVYYFNKKYDRVGHLFQGRFRSEVVTRDEHFLACSRYLHNNPVAAGIVDLPEEYPWSSYRIYLKRSESNLLVDTKFLLGYFSDNHNDAIKQLRQFTNCRNEDVFLDCDIHSHTYEDKKINEKEAIKEVLTQHKTDLVALRTSKDKVMRNTILRKLKSVSNLSIRELSEFLGISKDMIFRA